MKISFIKTQNDLENYKMAKGLGFDVFEIKEPEMVDQKIEELKQKDYHTIIIPDELASFSENIIFKYGSDPSIRIIITPNKQNH